MTEEDLHISVCRFISLQYPHIIFNTDLSGIRLTPGLARKAAKMRSSRAFPDLVIYRNKQIETRTENTISLRYYAALFIELKKDGTRIFKRNGELVADKHIREQAEMIMKLQARGFYADFAVGFDEAQRIIKWYLDGIGEPKIYIK